MVKKGEKCFTCGRYFDRHAVVDGLIVKDRMVLLELRNHEPDKGKWALVGGFVDWDETTEEAVIREVKEEIGVDAEVTRLFGVYSDPDRDNNRNIQNVAIVYLLRLLSEDFIINPEEVQEVRWFPLEDLSKNIAFDHQKVIEDYKKMYEI
jgi:8-oxo-dGTP diphosphatase